MAVENGSGFIIKWANSSSGTKEIYAHAQNASISANNSVIEVTTKDSLGWMENLNGKQDFSLSVDGLVDYATISNAHNTKDIWDAFIDQDTVYFEIGVGSNILAGTALIASCESSGGTEDAAVYSVSLTGTGALTKIPSS